MGVAERAINHSSQAVNRTLGPFLTGIVMRVVVTGKHARFDLPEITLDIMHFENRKHLYVGDGKSLYKMVLSRRKSHRSANTAEAGH